MEKELIGLLSELICIPSYVDYSYDAVNENQAGNYIQNFIKNYIPWLKVYSQPVNSNGVLSKTRFNIIATNSDKPKLIFISHIDTVLPAGDKNIRLQPNIVGNSIYGLGAVDMKGGLACSLVALKYCNPKLPVAAIFDCGEEYYFEGIKTFVTDYKLGKTPINKLAQPKLVIFPEPSNLLISNTCRGCVEVKFQLKGRTAHAGNISSSINAIEKSIELVNEIRNIIKPSTVNLAALKGGVLIDGKVSERANSVADIAEILLDIRIEKLKFNSVYIQKLITEIARRIGVDVISYETNLDLKPFRTSKNKLKKLEDAINNAKLTVTYTDNSIPTGYGEKAIIGEDLGWSTVDFGPGPGQKAHQVDEYVRITDLLSVTKIYLELFKLLK